MKINSQLILAFDHVLILVVGALTRDYKKVFNGHLEDTLEQILNCSRRSIFLVVEIWQEKIELESELQVGERGH